MYVAFVLSFLQVGVVWANHHAMFHYIRRTDHVLVALNLVLLMFVAVLPFTTALLSEYVRSDVPERPALGARHRPALGGRTEGRQSVAGQNWK